MQMEGCFKKDAKGNTCLCFKDKNQYVFSVMRPRWLTKTTIHTIYQQFDTKIAKVSVAEKKNSPRFKSKTMTGAECAHERQNERHCGIES